jgi:hypothetical protein
MIAQDSRLAAIGVASKGRAFFGTNFALFTTLCR